MPTKSEREHRKNELNESRRIEWKILRVIIYDYVVHGEKEPLFGALWDLGGPVDWTK